MLYSLFDNNRKEKITIHFLGNKLKEQDKIDLSDIAVNFEQEILFYDIRADSFPSELNDLFLSKIMPAHISLSTFSRLFISSILPNSVKRCIYLDGDILISSSISSLWEEDLQGKSIGWCIDGQRDNISSKRLGLNSYCNAGVLLIDLERWRQLDVEKMFVSFIKEKYKTLKYGDQDILNSIFAEDQTILHPKYNSMIYYYMKEPSYSRYIPQEYLILGREAVSNPVITHFISDVKPWHKDCDHPMLNEWKKYLKLTKWNHISLNYKRSLISRTKQKIIKIGKLMCSISPLIRKRYPFNPYIEI